MKDTVKYVTRNETQRVSLAECANYVQLNRLNLYGSIKNIYTQIIHILLPELPVPKLAISSYDQMLFFNISLSVISKASKISHRWAVNRQSNKNLKNFFLGVWKVNLTWKRTYRYIIFVARKNNFSQLAWHLAADKHSY